MNYRTLKHGYSWAHFDNKQIDREEGFSLTTGCQVLTDRCEVRCWGWERSKLFIFQPSYRDRFRKEPSVDADINGQKYGEKQNIYTVSKHHSPGCLLLTKGKSLDFREKKPGIHNLNQAVKTSTPATRYMNISTPWWDALKSYNTTFVVFLQKAHFFFFFFLHFSL